MRLVLLLAATAAISLLTSAGCRGTSAEGDSWSYARLQKEAAVVVVASFNESHDGDQSLIEERHRRHVEVKKASFRVEDTLKGKSRDNLILVYCQPATTDKLSAISGLAPVSFRTHFHWQDGGVKYGSKVQYLLYLAQGKMDGEFFPVSGVLNSSASVKMLLDAP